MEQLAEWGWASRDESDRLPAEIQSKDSCYDKHDSAEFVLLQEKSFRDALKWSIAMVSYIQMTSDPTSKQETHTKGKFPFYCMVKNNRNGRE